MPAVQRVLDPVPVGSLDAYCEADGGDALEAARQLGPEAVIEHVEASGLRGRGGAGFPTGRKWRTVTEFREPFVPATVVVNAAEGEPGTFKDRAIIRANPYRLLEGALVAASTVGADRVVIAVKRTFEQEIARLRAAMAEVVDAGWSEGVDLSLLAGPTEYLFGEETGLLEVVAGRDPFPRVAPPYRHGADEVADDDRPAPASVEMADPDPSTVAPPALVNNAETLANVPGIVARGPDWFRELGTPESPGSVVCTVSGSTRRAGVAEFAMGTPLREVVQEIGGGAAPGREITAVLSGVANPLLPARLLDTPLTYEDLDAAGAGLGAAGFLVFDDSVDLVALAQGVARFLAVESCGQCTPCKRDGLAVAEHLDRLRRSEEGGEYEVAAVEQALSTVTEGARCYLAQQTQRVVGSVLELFSEAVQAHARQEAPAAEPVLVGPIADIEGHRAVLEESQARKQPDWSYDDRWSGEVPAERLDERARPTGP